MKKTFFFIIALALNISFSCAWSSDTLTPDHDAPNEVAGFILGESIEKFKDRIKSDSRMCIRYQDYLQEVEVRMCPAFKSGLICIASCDRINQIVRIKLKYRDASKDFYNTLLKRFKNKYGEPNKWKGDAFGVMVAWKWSFLNSKREKISLILQHNSQDENLKMGNVVKIANTTLIENEKQCFLKKKQENTKNMLDKKELEPLNLSDPEIWEYIIPR